MATYNFYGYFVSSKVGTAGLSDVTVDVYSNNSGTSLLISAGTATAIGGGLYKYSYVNGTVSDYLAVFKTSDSGVDQQQIPALVPQQLAYIDTYVSGGNAGTATLTYTVYKSGGLEGATVKLYSDSGRTTLVNSKTSDVLGQVTFTNLVAGTYYLTTTMTGYEDMTDTEVVT
jgi:hypothetical protein